AGPFITTTQTLAAVFGSAIAGMVANLAGLADAATAEAIAATGHWLFGALMVLPVAACATAWRALALSRDVHGRFEPVRISSTIWVLVALGSHVACFTQTGCINEICIPGYFRPT